MSIDIDAMQQLLAIMAKLRDPEGGCPWDIKQTFQSIVPHTLEEAYEVAHAIEQQDWAELKEELGDLMFQVVFYAQLGQEQQLFDFNQIVTTLNEKLIRRHPHVFAQTEVADEEEVKVNWERIKAQERQHKPRQTSLLDSVPLALPGLSRAVKLQKRAAQVGFDWPDVGGVLDKIREELDELEAELSGDAAQDQHCERVADELGDLLFALTNLSRYLKRDPEQLLRATNRKFERRFRYIEQQAAAAGKAVDEYSLAELDHWWNQAKQQEPVLAKADTGQDD